LEERHPSASADDAASESDRGPLIETYVIITVRSGVTEEDTDRRHAALDTIIDAATKARSDKLEVEIELRS
jgi:hypothetical protein